MGVSITGVQYKGWRNNVRLANAEVDLVVTGDVGPRVIRFGFIGKANVFGELPGQIGTTGEKEWVLRGGHRLWGAPEEKPKTYELDNTPITIRSIAGGVKTVQAVGSLSGLAKTMQIRLDPRKNRVSVLHVLTNRSRKTVCVAPWALTVMARKGMTIIPLPEKISHTKRLTHNQEWSIWPYTDFADRRWTLGSRYVFFRQDPKKGPNKLGLIHREGWIAYQLGEFLFVKRFKRIEGAAYPDGGVNFETFSNEAIMEVETLGPLAALRPGQSVKHEETWELFRGVRPVKTEADADRYVSPLIR